jgi:hypothetical protein
MEINWWPVHAGSLECCCLNAFWLTMTQISDDGKRKSGLGRALSRFTRGKLSARNIPSRTRRNTHRKIAIIGQFVEQHSVYRAHRSLQWRRFITPRIRRRMWYYPLLSDISQNIRAQIFLNYMIVQEGEFRYSWTESYRGELFAARVGTWELNVKLETCEVIEFTHILTPWNRLPKKLTVPYLAKKFPTFFFFKSQIPLYCSQEPAIGPYPGPIKTSGHPH